MVRICGSHPQNPGSIPGSATKKKYPRRGYFFLVENQNFLTHRRAF